MVIHQGEQFRVPFTVKVWGDIATPENIDGLKIKLDRIQREYPGDLEYDETEQVWLFPLYEEDTLDLMTGSRNCQIAVKIGTDILKTDVFGVSIKNSIIREAWSDDGG